MSIVGRPRAHLVHTAGTNCPNMSRGAVGHASGHPMTPKAKPMDAQTVEGEIAKLSAEGSKINAESRWQRSARAAPAEPRTLPPPTAKPKCLRTGTPRGELARVDLSMPLRIFASQSGTCSTQLEVPPSTHWVQDVMLLQGDRQLPPNGHHNGAGSHSGQAGNQALPHRRASQSYSGLSA